MIEIRASKNGPYLVKGTEVVLKDGNGNPITVEKATFALCRCGASGNKPFCDGSHRRVEFRG